MRLLISGAIMRACAVFKVKSARCFYWDVFYKRQKVSHLRMYSKENYYFELLQLKVALQAVEPWEVVSFTQDCVESHKNFVHMTVSV